MSWICWQHEEVPPQTFVAMPTKIFRPAAESLILDSPWFPLSHFIGVFNKDISDSVLNSAYRAKGMSVNLLVLLMQQMSLAENIIQIPVSTASQEME